jgi:GT2 family glycosyltransferase
VTVSASAPGRVGLVVVTHNSEREIARCLDAIHRQTHSPDRIVLVDSGSTDGTRQVVDEVSAQLGLPVERVVFDDNVGFAVANNRAVAQLEDCEFVGLVNPDAFVERTWLATLVMAASRHPQAASFASRLMMLGPEAIVDGLGDAFHVTGLAWRTGHGQHLSELPLASTSRPVFSACAAAALYRREDWLSVDGFDERFFCYAEDVDLGFRLQLRGRGCLYVAEAVAHHVGSAASGVDSPFSVYHGYRNLEWTFLKNMPAALFWRHLPGHLLVNLIQLAWFTRKGRGRSLLAAKLDALREIGGVLRDRRRVQASRTASSRAISQVLDRTSLWTRLSTVRGRMRGQA